jgi:hypothetical protein
VLDAVPPDRLLVLPVADLDTVAGRARLARFAGVPEETLSSQSARRNPARARFSILERLPQGQLEAALDRHCADVWQRMNRMTA